MIILGTVQFGIPYGVNNSSGKVLEQEACEILDFAAKSGIQYLDTAPAYGSAEEVIGKFIVSQGGNPFKIITKFNFKNSNSCEESLLISLQNLHTPKVDTILFHSFADFSIHKNEIPELIKKYKGEKFNNLGVSVYTNDEITEIVNEPLIDTVQAPFNLLDNENKRKEAFIRLKNAGKQVHIRSVFLQGLFFMEEENMSPFFNELKAPLKKLKDEFLTEDISIQEAALLYPFNMDYIDGVLIGVDNLEQLKNNLSTIENGLPDTILKAIGKIQIDNEDLLNPSKWRL